MADKTRNKIGLEEIEEHLKRQDKEIQASHMVTLASFGVVVALVGVSAWLARIPDINMWDYAFFIILGLAVMFIALWWVLRIAKKDQKSESKVEKVKKFPWLSLTFVGFSVFLAGWVGALEALMAIKPKFIVSYLYVWFVVMFIGLAVMITPLWVFKNRKK